MDSSSHDAPCTDLIELYQRYENTSAKFYYQSKSILKHPENCQLKSTPLGYSSDGNVYYECFFFEIFASPEAVDCTPQKCIIYFGSYRVYWVGI